MSAGRMVHVIRIQRFTSNPNDYGTPVMTWAEVATLRAEVVQRSTEEFLRDGGAAEEASIVFRTRFLDGITGADRVAFGAETFGIKEVTPIGRRKGLELRCMALEAG